MKRLLFVLLTLLCFTSFAEVRIVSLASSLTQNIQLLGKENVIVGCTSFCPMSSGSKAEIVATAIDANVEKIISLKPDCVLATGLSRPQTLQMIEKFGIKVQVLNYPESYADICSQFLQIAEIIGSGDVASKLLAEQNARLEEISKEVAGNNLGKVFVEIGANPLFTAIDKTYMHEMIEMAGGVNVAVDMKQESITRESVVIRNPDFIFIVAMGDFGPDEVKIWSKYSAISAAKKKQIFLIDQKACAPTPTNFVDTVEEMHGLMRK